MAGMDDIAQERKKLEDRLARLDAERAKVADQLNELEVAERVLSRFGKPGQRRRRGRPAAAPAAAAAKPAAGRRTAGRKAAAGRKPAAARKPVGRPARGRGRPRRAAGREGISLSDATLRIVRSHGSGIAANDVMTALSREYGLSPRPNHLGIALQRHRRGGRLDQRDSLWYPPSG